jgi:hypothetical protein
MEVNPNCDVASICGGEATNADIRLIGAHNPCHFSGWIIQPHFINNLNLLCFTIFQSSLQVMNGSQNTNPDKSGTKIFLEYIPWRKQGSDSTVCPERSCCMRCPLLQISHLSLRLAACTADSLPNATINSLSLNAGRKELSWRCRTIQQGTELTNSSPVIAVSLILRLFRSG